MKNLKIAIFAFLLFAGANSIQAQDEENKWALSFGVNMVDVANGGLGSNIKDYLGTKDWNIIPAVSKLDVSRYMNHGLSVQLSASLNKIDQAADAGEVNGLSFFAISASANYDLNIIGFIDRIEWFDPYIGFGIGSTWVDSNSAFTLQPGAGFNTWFNDNIGLNFASTYNYGTSPWDSMGASVYFQHSLGLIIRFNGDE